MAPYGVGSAAAHLALLQDSAHLRATAALIFVLGNQDDGMQLWLSLVSVLILVQSWEGSNLNIVVVRLIKRR